MKKKLSLLLVLCMLFSLLSACGGSTTTETSSASSEASEATETVESAEEAASQDEAAEEAVAENAAEEPAEEETVAVEITLPITEEPTNYTMWTTLHPAYMNYVTDLADLTVWTEIAERTNIYFEFTAVSGITAEDSFNLMMAGGDYCDIITEMDLFSDGIESAIDQEILQDLSGLIADYCPTYWDMVCSDASAYLTLVTDNGSVGTIAILRGETVSTDLNTPLVRNDWLSEFGLDAPETLDDLYEYMVMAKSTYDATSEFSSDGLDSKFLTTYNLSGDYVVEDGVVKSVYTLDRFRTYLETTAQWYAEGLIDPDFYTINDNTENATKVANGQYALATNSAQGLARVLQYVTDPDSTIDLLPIAFVTDGEEIHVGQEAALIDDQDAWAITTACDNIEPLLTLVEYMFSEEGQLLFNYGIEGETYTLDADGTPQWTEFMTDDPDYAFDVQEYLYANATIPSVRDYSREMYDYSENELRAVEVTSNPGDCAYNYPDYAVMTSDESSSYSALESDLTTYTESAILSFITGQTELNDSTWEEFQNTVASMGIDEMVSYKQAAYDRAMEKLSVLG